ncbi:hypothetical protein BDV06DRAFT_220847 [Aspergillus oleicola]
MSPMRYSSSSPSGKGSAATSSSTRRNKTMPTDSDSSRFFYAIIKQLDLKRVNWKLVASQNGISNAHAARMRFHRFRNEIENIKPRKRKQTASNTQPKKSKSPLKQVPGRKILPKPSSPIENETFASDDFYEPKNISPPTKIEHPRESIEPSPDFEIEQPYVQPVPRLSDMALYAPPMVRAPCPTSYPFAFSPAIETPYIQMNLAPELETSSCMLSYPPVPGTLAQQNPSPLPWTPFKVETPDLLEKDEGMDMAGAQVNTGVLDEFLFCD